MRGLPVYDMHTRKPFGRCVLLHCTTTMNERFSGVCRNPCTFCRDNGLDALESPLWVANPTLQILRVSLLL